MPADLLFCDGFDYYATADLLIKWNTQVSTVASPTYTPTVTSSAARTSAQGFRVAMGALVSGGTNLPYECSLRKTVAPSNATAVLGFAFKYSAAQTGLLVNLAGIRDTGTYQCFLRLNPAGTLSVVQGPPQTVASQTILGTTVTALSAGTWYYVEWKLAVHPSLGTVDVYINGVNALALTAQNTRTSSVSQWNELALGNVAANAGLTSFAVVASNFDFDDIYLADGSGAAPYGDITIATQTAQTGNGANTGFTCSTGSDHGANVDDTTEDGDSTYNSTSTVNTKDTYTLSDLSGAPTIKGLQTVLVARKTTAGARLIAPVLRIGGTDYVGTDNAPSTTYYQFLNQYNVSPATSAAFTLAVINAMEAGIKVTL